METKKRKPDIELEKNDTTPVMSSSPTMLMSLQSGTVSIVEAVSLSPKTTDTAVARRRSSTLARKSRTVMKQNRF